MKILVALDGSRLAESMLPWAVFWARQTNAQVVLVRVCDPGSAVAPDLPEPLKTKMQQLSLATAREYLGSVAAAFEGLPVECHHPPGRARHEIPELARRLNCQLIFVASHGRTGPDRWILGSVAEGVLRRSTCPVLLLRPPLNTAACFQNVLVPVDGSPESLAALENLAPFLASEARVTLFQSSGLCPIEMGVEEDSEVLQHYLDQIATQLRQWTLPHHELEVVVTHGDPVECILTRAREQGCDLIAMSTLGRSGDPSLWLGSVTEKVARAAPCPVLACPGRRPL